MGFIRQLDSITINKIAAGEVIDRPASIIKELIENCIDSGATKIHIDTLEGGIKLIKVTDNGKGITKDDLPLAPLRHTTSKITSINDIYALNSFGFRGEALASICHVGKTTITSKTIDADAYKITVYKDQISTPYIASHPQGTTITVQQLFEDLPVRQRFLKSARTELSYISDIVTQFALVFPLIDFVLTHNEKECINSTGIQKQDQLILHLFTKTLRPYLVPVSTDIGPVHIEGTITDPGISFPNRSKQIISVNGRLIKNPILQKAIQQAYKDIIPQRRFPLTVLSITIDQDSIDVNVHPQKLDVKFINPGFIFDSIPKAISISLQNKQQKIGELNQSSSRSYTPLYEKFQPENASVNLPDTHTYPAPSYVPPIPKDIRPTSYELTAATRLFDTPLHQKNKPFDYFQLFDTYIVVRTDDGLWLLDQHAVHERILYEKFKEAQHSPQTFKQGLLLSEVMDIAPDLMPIIEEEKDYLDQLGFTVELFGSQQIVIRDIPTLFSGASIQDLLLDILIQLKEIPGSSRNLTLDQKETLQMKACKAAIKAGKTLAPQEVKQLIEDLVKSPSNFTCPHGRPLFILLDKNKLERLFLRQ